MNKRAVAVAFLTFIVVLAVGIIIVNALQLTERKVFERQSVEEWAKENNVTIQQVDVALVNSNWTEVESENEFLQLLNFFCPPLILWSRQYGYCFFARPENCTYYLDNGVVILR